MRFSNKAVDTYVEPATSSKPVTAAVGRPKGKQFTEDRLGMSDKITTHQSRSQGIILTHSKAGAGFQLLFQIGFFVVWYWLPLGKVNKSRIQLIFLVFPVLFIPQGLRLLQALRGLTYSFDPSTRTIKKNTEKIASFEEVERVQIRNIHGESPKYRLALVLRGDKKIRLAQTTNEEQVRQATDEIADLVGVTVHSK